MLWLYKLQDRRQQRDEAFAQRYAHSFARALALYSLAFFDVNIGEWKDWMTDDGRTNTYVRPVRYRAAATR